MFGQTNEPKNPKIMDAQTQKTTEKMVTLTVTEAEAKTILSALISYENKQVRMGRQHGVEKVRKTGQTVYEFVKHLI